jgi:hypothetical protein
MESKEYFEPLAEEDLTLVGGEGLAYSCSPSC